MLVLAAPCAAGVIDRPQVAAQVAGAFLVLCLLSSATYLVNGQYNPAALQQLNWFLRDFGYDPDLMGRDEVDEKVLLGLRGIVRTSRTILNGRCFLNLDGFAPAADWGDLERAPLMTGQEVRHDL